MKIKKLENGIELIPENEFEEECLRHIAYKPLTAEHEDSWERKGNLIVKFQKPEW